MNHIAALVFCKKWADPAALRLAICIAMLAVLAVPRPAQAQQQEPGYEVDYAIDGVITGLAAGGALLTTLVPVDTSKRWDSELLGSFDIGVRANFSASAVKLSDALVAATVAMPVLLQIDRGLDDQAGRRLLLHGESLSVTLLANGATKFLVQRPRPYVYNGDSRVIAYARGEGKDSHVSFYSGHSAVAFTAATTGSYLFALGTDDQRSKVAAWLLQFTMASATANLRVRAGKHYYSDIFVGALLGVAAGYLVPALHADERGVYKPSGVEIAAMVGGVLAGGLVSQLVPLESDIAVPLGQESGPAATGTSSVSLVPTVYDHGGGFALIGLL
jgi:membrane-associated phospholipid phosphatase